MKPGPLHQSAAASARPLRIDVHAHLAVDAADALMRPHVTPKTEPAMFFASEDSRTVSQRNMAAIRCKLTGIDERLNDMDRSGIDVQLLSPSPHHYYYWAEPELGLRAATLVNDALAGQVARVPERFAALGTVPLQDAELSVRELTRCLDELGFCGVEIGSNVAGAELDDPRFADFFAAAAERGAFVFLHPLGFTHGERLRKFHLNNVIGNPLESAIALSHLILGGVLERHPDLRLCVAHGGGYLPMYAGRMDHAWAAREDCRRSCPRRPSEYLKQLYFDTVVFDHEQLAYLVEQYGAEHILLGTDYPFDMSETAPLELLASQARLDASQRAAISGGNAARLLRLSPAQQDAGSEDFSSRALARAPFELGLRELGQGTYAYLQPDGGWSLSNAGLIVDGDQSLLVDTLFDLPLTAAMLAAMRRAEPTAARRIGTLINTHANPDHTNGNSLVEGAEIIASAGTARELSKQDPSRTAQMLAHARANADHDETARYMVEIFGRFQLDGIENRLPTRVFERELQLQVGDTPVHLIDLGPAHTSSDVVVYLPRTRTVFTGDILFIGGHPILWAGPVDNWLRACERILALDVEYVVPGHGPVVDKQGVRAMHAYFTLVAARARAAQQNAVPIAAAAYDIARELEGTGFRTWREAERLVSTVGAIYRESAREAAAPANPGEMFGAMAKLASQLKREREHSQ